MQKHKLFTVYDEKAEAFLPPFFVPTEGIAKRAFSDCVNNKEHAFGKHPQDYSLFYMGEFFDDNGQIVLTDRKSLGNGVEFLRPELADTPEELHDGKAYTPVSDHQASGNSA